MLVEVVAAVVIIKVKGIIILEEDKASIIRTKATKMILGLKLAQMMPCKVF